jgi:Tol biopolymer transport system component
VRYLSETGNRKYRYIMLLAVILFGVVSILGTGGDGDGGGTPPIITAVAPAQSSDSALVTALVTAQFGIDMDGTSINDSSFTLVDNAMTAVLASNISYDVGSRIATFVPSTDLTSGMQYIATLTTAVQDAAGNNPLVRDYVWSFQIAPTLVPVAVNSNGVYGDSTSTTPASDQTGRYVVFESAATTLVSGITINSPVQIYRKDTVSGEVQLVSTDYTGLVTADGDSAAPRISADGRYVVFDSPATNLDTGIASGGIRQVYLKDMQTGAITLLSRANATTGGNGASSNADISADGRYVVFESAAPDLVSGISLNAPLQIYRIGTGTLSGNVQLVSTNDTGVTANGAAAAPRISADGHYVVFDSPATNLDTDVASGGIRQVYLKDMQTGAITLLSRANATTGGDNVSSSPDISADGRFIAFHSNATDLIGIGNDTNGARDVFLHDTQTTTTTRVSVTTGGAQVNGASSAPAISADGRYIVFESVAANLVPGDTNGISDVFLRDTQTTLPATTRLSVTTGGDQANGASGATAISADGRYVAFESAATNLVAGETINVPGIYRAHLTHQ